VNVAALASLLATSLEAASVITGLIEKYGDAGPDATLSPEDAELLRERIDDADRRYRERLARAGIELS
jgi:hypothetical protein